MSSQATPPSTCLPPVFILKHGDQRLPIWPNPPPLHASTLPPFCLPEYRSAIVDKFRNHINLHPDIPINDIEGTRLTATEIYEGALEPLVYTQTVATLGTLSLSRGTSFENYHDRGEHRHHQRSPTCAKNTRICAWVASKRASERSGWLANRLQSRVARL